MPDESLLFDRLTGVEFLEFVGRMYGLPRPTAIERAARLIDLFQLQADRKIIGEYSKGMRKRVAMAASLIHHPELFLMDEPFEGVDAVGARLMKDILAGQVERGATIFLTTHVLEVVERLCDRVAIINEGRIVTSGSAEELRAGGESLEDAFVRLVGAEHQTGAAGLAMIAAILRAQFLSMRLGGRGRVFGVITGSLVRPLGSGRLRRLPRRVGPPPDSLRTLLPFGALAVCAYWQVMPILSASMGSGLDMRKLMVYPVPHAKLFQVEVLLRLTTGVEMLMVLLGAVAGLFRRSAQLWLAIVPAGLIFIAFNCCWPAARAACWSACFKRKVRELLVFLIFMIWMVPRFLFATGGVRKLTAMDALDGALRRGPGPPPRGPLWDIRNLRAALSGVLDPARRDGSAARQFERNLRFDAVGGASHPAHEWRTRLRAAEGVFTAFRRAGFATRSPPSWRRNSARWRARRAIAWSL